MLDPHAHTRFHKISAEPGPLASRLPLTDSVPGRILNGNLTVQVNDDQLCFFWLVGMLVAILSWLEVLSLVLTEGGIVGPDRPPSAQPPRAPLPFRTANRLVRRPNSFNHDTAQTLRIASRAFDRITTTHATLAQLVALLPQPCMSTVAAS